MADLPTRFHTALDTAALDGPAVTDFGAAEVATLLSAGFLGAVWLTGQIASRDLRRGRYTDESNKHPGKMLPTIAHYAILTYTAPGDVVFDPMAGIGTTLVEAMLLGRHGVGVGVESEPEWVAEAADNIRHAAQAGAPGRTDIYCGDSTTPRFWHARPVPGRNGSTTSWPPTSSTRPRCTTTTSTSPGRPRHR